MMRALWAFLGRGTTAAYGEKERRRRIGEKGGKERGKERAKGRRKEKEREGKRRKEKEREGKRKKRERKGRKKKEKKEGKGRRWKKRRAHFAQRSFFLIFVARNNAIGGKTNLKTTV